MLLVFVSPWIPSQAKVKIVVTVTENYSENFCN